MRVSSYSILSDSIPGMGRVLMNGVTGALDLLDDDLGERLKTALDEGKADRIIDDLDDEVRAQFVERGHLTDWSADEERRIVVILAEAAHEAMRGKPSFMIVPNLDCNYRCTYCFERPLQNTLKSASAEITHRKGNVVLRQEQIGQIYDAIGGLRAEQGLEAGGQIILYGGEPLDRNNGDVVFPIVREGVERGYEFAVITNGHDLDAYMDCLGVGLIGQIQVSIDGPKAVHDKRRVYVGRGSSFDQIVLNVRRVLAETDAEIQIRVHVDPANIHLFGEVIDLFEAEGWLDHPQVVIYGNTVYERSVGGGVLARIEHGDIDQALASIAGRARNIHTSAPEIHAARSTQPALLHDERFKLKGTYCSANSGNYIFAPDGAVYACWESVGKACSRIGRYGADGVALDQTMADRWFKRSIASQPGCQTCAYALVCGGGCAQYAEYETGDLYSAYCDDFQRVFRSALARTVGRTLGASVEA